MASLQPDAYIEMNTDNAAEKIIHAVRRHQQEIPKRRRKSSKNAAVFYSVDGDAVPSYTVEINTDAASTVCAESSVISPGHRNASPHASRFTYSDSLRQDVVEDFSVVKFRYKDHEEEPIKRVIPTSANRDGVKKAAVVTPTKSPREELAQTFENLVSKTFSESQVDPYVCKGPSFEVTNSIPEALEAARKQSEGPIRFLRHQASTLREQLQTQVTSRGNAVEIFPSCNPVPDDQFTMPEGSKADGIEIFPSCSPHETRLDRENSVLDQTTTEQASSKPTTVLDFATRRSNTKMSNCNTHGDAKKSEPAVQDRGAKRFFSRSKSSKETKRISSMSGHRVPSLVQSKTFSAESSPQNSLVPEAAAQQDVPSTRPTESAPNAKFKGDHDLDRVTSEFTNVSISSESTGLNQILDEDKADEVDAIMKRLTELKKVSSRRRQDSSNKLSRKSSRRPRSDDASAAESSFGPNSYATACSPIPEEPIGKKPSRLLDVAKARDILEKHGRPPKGPKAWSRARTRSSAQPSSIMEDENEFEMDSEMAADLELLDHFLEDHYYDSNISTMSNRTPTGLEGCIVSSLVNMANWLDGEDEELLAAKRSYGPRAEQWSSAYEEVPVDAVQRSFGSFSGVADSRGTPRYSRRPRRTRHSRSSRDNRRQADYDPKDESCDSSDDSYYSQDMTIEEDCGCY